MKLRERLTKAEEKFEIIKKVVNEMDDNHSTIEEEEFVDDVLEDIPEIDSNISNHQKDLDSIDVAIKEVHHTKNSNDVKTITKNMSEAQVVIEKTEQFVETLETDITEWDAKNKLIRRDKELTGIKASLKDSLEVIDQDILMLEEQIKKKQEKISKDKDHKEEYQSQINGLKEHIEETVALKEQLQRVMSEQKRLFQAFNEEIPSVIKQERVARFKSDSYVGHHDELTTHSSAPDDMYSMLSVNCKFRKEITHLHKESKELIELEEKMDEKFKPLLQKLCKWTPPPLYKPVKTCEIDVLFAVAINKAQLNLSVKRTDVGKYVFGTKNILAKIVNGRLLVRVGGGYLGVEEFIEQHGPMEVAKQNEIMSPRKQKLNSLG